MNLNYVSCGDYFIPALKINDADLPPLGKYGRLRKAYLLKYRKPLYTTLSIKDELFRHCAGIEVQTRTRLAEIIASQIQATGVTEELKASDPIRWAGLMNTIKAQAEEVVLQEIIFR